MSEGPFKPENFESIRGYEMNEECSDAIERTKLCSDIANSHPFVKEAHKFMKYFKALASEESWTDLESEIDAFLSKYFPKEGE